MYREIIYTLPVTSIFSRTCSSCSCCPKFGRFSTAANLKLDVITKLGKGVIPFFHFFFHFPTFLIMTILAKKVMDEGWLNIFMRPYFTRRVAAEFFLQKFYTIYKCAESSKRKTFLSKMLLKISYYPSINPDIRFVILLT